jgi:hypothetical protein
MKIAKMYEESIEKNEHTGKTVTVKVGKFKHKGIYLGEDRYFKQTHFIGIQESTCKPNEKAPKGEYLTAHPFFASFKQIKFEG